jgi:hypothetical protein
MDSPSTVRLCIDTSGAMDQLQGETGTAASLVLIADHGVSVLRAHAPLVFVCSCRAPQLALCLGEPRVIAGPLPGFLHLCREADASHPPLILQHQSEGYHHRLCACDDAGPVLEHGLAVELRSARCVPRCHHFSTRFAKAS